MDLPAPCEMNENRVSTAISVHEIALQFVVFVSKGACVRTEGGARGNGTQAGVMVRNGGASVPASRSRKTAASSTRPIGMLSAPNPRSLQRSGSRGRSPHPLQKDSDFPKIAMGAKSRLLLILDAGPRSTSSTVWA